MYTRILIPLDGSKTAEQALPYARTLANKLKVPLELMGVIDIAEFAAHISAEKARYLERIIEQGERSSVDYLKGIAKTFPGLSVICTVEKGTAAETIIDKAAADKGTLITMATHGRSGINRFVLGSVAEKVLRATNNPLLLVRAADGAAPGEEARLTSVIVPLDGSELAESVLPAVTELAKKLGLEIVLFRAFNIPYGVYAGADGYYAMNFDQLIADIKDEATAYLETKTEELKGKGVESVSFLVKEGLSADEIISIGRQTPDNLIAMCTHGRSGVKRWVLGSVTESVVRHCGDPVLVIRAA
ncbi:MAG TPA: universal stress protein [Candidatus Binatia bacterium]